jgi:hypothetical protein
MDDVIALALADLEANLAFGMRVGVAGAEESYYKRRD